MLKSCFTSVWLAAAVVALLIANNFIFDLPDEPEPAAGKFFDAGGGVRVHYTETPGEKPTIVFVHGLPGTAADFDNVARRLAGRHIIQIDRPGYGYSTGGTQDMFAQAETVHDLLASRNVKGATVVGHSYGGPLAIALAHEHPRDVARIATLAGAGGGMQIDEMNKVNAELIRITHLPVIEQVNELFFSNMVLRGLASVQVKEAFNPEDVVPAYKERTLTFTLKDSDLEALRENTLDFDDDVARVDDFMDEVRQPALVMQGRGDKLVAPQYATAIARALPRAKLVELDGGHMFLISQPTRVAKEIKALERR
ncbi:MAG: alpha/beta hydrolase [Actinobacteria bacterium]|nr:alpha/beta hydrolase [Actinomycetota bacterium]